MSGDVFAEMFPAMEVVAPAETSQRTGVELDEAGRPKFPGNLLSRWVTNAGLTTPRGFGQQPAVAAMGSFELLVLEDRIVGTFYSGKSWAGDISPNGPQPTLAWSYTDVHAVGLREKTKLLGGKAASVTVVNLALHATLEIKEARELWASVRLDGQPEPALAGLAYTIAHTCAKSGKGTDRDGPWLDDVLANRWVAMGGERIAFMIDPKA